MRRRLICVEAFAALTLVGSLSFTTLPEAQPGFAGEVQKRAVIADCIGPMSSQGSGLRNLALIQDLTSCGFRVDLVVDPCRCELPRLCQSTRTRQGLQASEFGWGPRLTEKYLQGKIYITSSDKRLAWSSYDLIVMFAWVTRPFPGDLKQLAQHRNKTIAVFDDVPHRRCYTKCEEVSGLMTEWSTVASRWFMLHKQDAAEVELGMSEGGSTWPRGRPRIGAWPLRLGNIAEQLGPDWQRMRSSAKKSYITMIGNNHGENRQAVRRFFESGSHERLCSTLKQQRQNVTVLFVGTIGKFVEQLGLNGSECVSIKGVIPDSELYTSILPRTLAILNPFFTDLHSGISVKSYQALATGIPVLTSTFGLRGLLDMGCDITTVAAKDPDFAGAIAALLAHTQSYLNESLVRARSCMSRQEAVYPRCSAVPKNWSTGNASLAWRSS